MRSTTITTKLPTKLDGDDDDCDNKVDDDEALDDKVDDDDSDNNDKDKVNNNDDKALDDKVDNSDNDSNDNDKDKVDNDDDKALDDKVDESDDNDSNNNDKDKVDEDEDELDKVLDNDDDKVLDDNDDKEKVYWEAHDDSTTCHHKPDAIQEPARKDGPESSFISLSASSSSISSFPDKPYVFLTVLVPQIVCKHPDGKDLLLSHLPLSVPFLHPSIKLRRLNILGTQLTML